ncbi:MAG: hypothetical protein RQ966_04540 [Acetobacteraceae bacterium]|nr:hypothetical protein [Acetobacteraceae bacterium]
MAHAGQVPEIVTFQMDASASGVVRSSVNLFRGDVTLMQSLLRMPGRDSDSALSASVSILYQSNVLRDAMTWNRDRPTGVLGLGWAGCWRGPPSCWTTPARRRRAPGPMPM